jgi:hypothetical protein
MESRHLHAADNVLTCRRNLIRQAGNVRSLGTTLSANQFRLRATQYAYRWPGAAPASTPCPREGAGPCPPIPCGGGASPDENGVTATLGTRYDGDPADDARELSTWPSEPMRGTIFRHCDALSKTWPRRRPPYRTCSSLIARAESCAASWTPVCAILMIFFAIIPVRGSPRSLTQRVCNACSCASMMQLTSFGPSPNAEFSNRR